MWLDYFGEEFSGGLYLRARRRPLSNLAPAGTLALRHPRAEQAEGRRGDPRIHAVTSRPSAKGAAWGRSARRICYGMDPRVSLRSPEDDEVEGAALPLGQPLLRTYL
jgi:hypothetical protein